ncbi:MAG TPA: cyclic nucleotide-binding domain-containing protein [Myxococcota bacterium]|nr:cyclic nucleotide-binding domain-containing protein [Myxococcota bacterium]
MRRVSELFWRFLPAVRRAERSRATYFTALFTLLSASQTFGLVGSEALLLARLGSAELPKAFVSAALVTVAGSLAYASAVGVLRNDRLYIGMLTGAAALLGLATAGAGDARVLIGLYCAFYLTQAVFMSHFWTFSGDYFDTLTSKRLFPVFTVGSSFGGLLGGAASLPAIQAYGAESLIAGWAAGLAGSALLLWLGRRLLRTWVPREQDEADETSVQSMRAAASYLRRAPLGRALAVSALGMVLALFIAQYLYSQIFAAAFPKSEELAAFIGSYLAVTNAIEIALELWLTPWLIRRLGVPSAQLFHPMLVLASFAGLGLRPGVVSGVAARAARELVDNAVGQPIRSLVCNALPRRLRGQLRAFLEGVVVYAGMAAAGALLLVLREPPAQALAALGGLAAALYLGAGLVVRREYVRELEAAIRAGRLDLSEVEGIGSFESSRLSEVARALLREETERASPSLLRMLPELARHGAHDLVREGLAHPLPAVRAACIAALADASPGDPDALRAALRDADASVRGAALDALARHPESADALREPLAGLQLDPDVRVRAKAAALAGAEGVEWLRRMLRSADEAEATAAAAVAPTSLAAEIAARLRQASPRLRAVGLGRIAETAPETALPPVVLEEALDAPEPRLRGAALRLLSRRPAPDLPRVARGLADSALVPRGAAIAALASHGEAGVAAAEPYLRDGRERAVRAALEVVARVDLPSRRECLRRELLHHARGMWVSELAQPLVSQGGDIPSTFLRAAFADEAARHRRLAFRILGLDGNPRAIRTVYRALRFGASRARGDALEVLSNLGDREAARLLVLRFEGELDEEHRAAAKALVRVPGERAELLRESRCAESLWIRAATAALDPSLGHNAVGVETMERLLALKKVPLFESLTLDQLDAVARLGEERDFQPGEVIVCEGESGGELYVLLEGAVEVSQKRGELQVPLRTIEAVAYFGEMAVLDDQPRSATIVAREPSRLLALAGTSLKELILQMPDISFEILRVLSARVRAAEQQARLSEPGAQRGEAERSSEDKTR